MASLNISNATYGRDKTGLKVLKSNLQGDIDSAIKVLTGTEYNNVINTIKSNWSGQDADQFINSFKQSVDQIANQFKTYKSKIISALDSDANQFAKMQSNNAEKVSSTIRKIV